MIYPNSFMIFFPTMLRVVLRFVFIVDTTHTIDSGSRKIEEKGRFLFIEPQT